MNRKVGLWVAVFVLAWAVFLHAQATTASFVGTGLRQSRTNSSLTFVPDANLSRGIYPGVSASQIVPVMLDYLAQYPLPNGPQVAPGIAQHTFAAKSTAQDDVATARIDHQLSPNDSLFGRMTYSNSDTNDELLGGFE